MSLLTILTEWILPFLVAIGILIAVHEWGHYRMAVACGVKVLRFSIGFGTPIVRFKPKKQRPGQDTEFVISLIPIGGYVKMLDGREGEVPEDERHLAFDAQPLKSRALIVAAGPVANLVLAVLLYAAVQWIGVQEPRAILSMPVAESLAAKAGLQSGDTVQRAALAGDELQPVASFERLHWILVRGVLGKQDVTLEVARAPDERLMEVTLPTSGLDARKADERLFRAVGIVFPFSRAEIGDVAPDGAAARAGLRTGDLVLDVDGVPIRDGWQLYDMIRAAGAHGQPLRANWQIERDGHTLTLKVQPDLYENEGLRVGRIGAVVWGKPAMVKVQQGVFNGLATGARQAWEVSTLSLRLLAKMVTGGFSVKNLSGPIAIADLAGRAAHMGLTYFIGLLAFISVSLGVFNLLPVPVLDGGQLFYFLWEAVTGKPVTGAWAERLQYVGLSLLLAIMAIAMYNDISTRWPF